MTEQIVLLSNSDSVNANWNFIYQLHFPRMFSIYLLIQQ